MLGYGVFRASDTQVARMVTRMKYSKGWTKVQTESDKSREGSYYSDSVNLLSLDYLFRI